MKDISAALAEYDKLKPTLEAFCQKTKELINASLLDTTIRIHSVQYRVKDRTKLQHKYSDPSRAYESLTDITDLAGLRIITYYDDDIDRVGDVLARELEVDGIKSIDHRKTEPDRFRYGALHLICRHAERRRSDVEYKKFSTLCCEIQITSLLRHAWSEIEHEWYDLGGAYPSDIKRRFSRLAALLDLAESEFIEMRKLRTDYQRSVAVRVEANISDLQVDGVSMKTFLGQEALVKELDSAITKILGQGFESSPNDKIIQRRAADARFLGLENLSDVRTALVKNKQSLLEFVERCRQELFPNAPLVGKLNRGVCIFFLALLLNSSRGLQQVLQWRAELYKGHELPWDQNRQISIAREVLKDTDHLSS